MSTIDTPAPAPGFRLTGWRVLAIFVVFFSVVIGVDTLFSVFALRTFSGEAAKDPYEAGILFNQTLAKRRAEAALGWQAVWTLDAGRAELTFTDAAGQPLDGLTIGAVLIRPATESGQRPLAFTPAGHGVYTASLAGLHGAWDLQATARNPKGDVLDVQHRMLLP